ncbi:MAG TPA: hypothetical protein VJS91_02070 [Nitrososphaeraceae archaeon]|nr:hypothetical protein [Nitrososphaeraceae archaeon]
MVDIDLRELLYILRRYLLFVLFCLILSLSVFSNNHNFHIEKIYAHLFTPNETATFVSIVYQLQAELELVSMNLANNNLSLAQNHASKASSLLTQRILAEIAEDNPKLASDLGNRLIQLQTISSTSADQVQSTSRIVSGLNERLNEDALVRMAQLQPDSSNFLEGFTKTLGNIFGGDDKEVKEQNAKIEALALANVIDGVLINYGNAYQVGFDMTNMSNMVMSTKDYNAVSIIMNNSSDGNKSATANMSMNMNMHSLNSSSSAMAQHDNEMNDRYSLVNVSDYQSAQALVVKASIIFNDKLKFTEIDNKNISGYITNLENGLTQLNNLVAKKDSPLDAMMTVHTQIHPNLLEAFSLQLR